MKKIFIGTIILVSFVISAGLIAYAEAPASKDNSSVNSVNSSSADVSGSGNARFYESYSYEEHMVMIESDNEEIIKEALAKEGKEYNPEKKSEEPEVTADPAADEGFSWYGIRERVLKKKGLPLDTKRITLEEVKDIIATSADIKEIVCRIEEIHIAADFHGGSGITRSEYWLDDAGTTKIVVLYNRLNLSIYFTDSSAPDNEQNVKLYEFDSSAYSQN
jgi:hypothetical protein